MADSLLSAGWGDGSGAEVPPTRRANRLGFAEIGARRPPHEGEGWSTLRFMSKII